MLRLHQYQYHRPRRLDEALDLLYGHDDAMPIAGGTDLMPNMKHRLFTPNHLVGLKAVAEMRGIFLADEDANPAKGEDAVQLVIGAGETLSAVSANPLVREHFSSLASAAGLVAGPQIRNQGTMGGNLCLDTRCTYYNQSHFWRQALGYCLKKDGEVCHVTKVGRKCVAAASADTPPVLITLRAVADLAGGEAPRTVPIEEFFVADGIWNTVRDPGEIVVRIRIALPPPGTRLAYQKVRQRNSIDFPLLSIALSTRTAPDDTLEAISLVISALGARPRVISGLEKVAVGLPMARAREAVAEQAFKQSRPLENIVVDPEWRRAMVPVYVRRAMGA